MSDEREAARSAEIAELAETLAHALHSTQTAQGWYGAPECEEVGRALAPEVQALLAQAKTEVLREAADAVVREFVPPIDACIWASEWLRDRAERSYSPAEGGGDRG